MLLFQGLCGIRAGRASVLQPTSRVLPPGLPGFSHYRFKPLPGGCKRTEILPCPAARWLKSPGLAAFSS